MKKLIFKEEFRNSAVDAKTGKEQWKFETGSSIINSSPTVSDGIVYVGSHDNHLYALKMISPDEE